MFTRKIGQTVAQRVPALIAAIMLAAVGGWVVAPGTAAAESQCKSYCSGPHKNYDECMEKCIASQQDYHPRRAERSIEDLCRGRGHDEEACLREHGFREPPRPAPCYRDQWGRTVCERN